MLLLLPYAVFGALLQRQFGDDQHRGRQHRAGFRHGDGRGLRPRGGGSPPGLHRLSQLALAAAVAASRLERGRDAAPAQQPGAAAQQQGFGRGGGRYAAGDIGGQAQRQRQAPEEAGAHRLDLQPQRVRLAALAAGAQALHRGAGGRLLGQQGQASVLGGEPGQSGGCIGRGWGVILHGGVVDGGAGAHKRGRPAAGAGPVPAGSQPGKAKA